MSDGGKGSGRRPGDNDAYSSGWDRIFGKSKHEKALDEMVKISQELNLYEESDKRRTENGDSRDT